MFSKDRPPFLLTGLACLMILMIDGFLGVGVQRVASMVAYAIVVLVFLIVAILGLIGSILEILDRLFGWKFGLPDRTENKKKDKAEEIDLLFPALAFGCIFVLARLMDKWVDKVDGHWPWAVVLVVFRLVYFAMERGRKTQ